VKGTAIMLTFAQIPQQAKDAFLAHLAEQRPFEDADVTEVLHGVASMYLDSYTGENNFLRSVQQYSAAGNWITTRQARGVLNTMLRGMRDAAARRNEAKPQAAPMTTETKQVRAIERAKTERVRLYSVEGRPDVYRTRSKSDPTVHYTVAYNRGAGVVCCSCKGYENHGCCKHSEALASKIAREAKRTNRKAA
jgi:hypothetical protein